MSRPPDPRILNQRDCLLCEGNGWVAVPDPLFDGTLVDQRCPACEDQTVRAPKQWWAGDSGQTSGHAGAEPPGLLP